MHFLVDWTAKSTDDHGTFLLALRAFQRSAPGILGRRPYGVPPSPFVIYLPAPFAERPIPRGFVLKFQSLLATVLLALPLSAMADQLVPAGSIINCTISEGSISSKTMNVGDPVLCTLGHSEAFGRSSFPYGSYLMGHFAEYKDPGHFVGKGWMELDFDKLIVQPDTVVPLNARVVATPKNKVDKDGRIQGTGHATKDTVMWLIPVLWPIDLINLPRRGPTPTLKAETKLTLRVMDDFGIPTPQEDAVRKPALIARQTPDEVTYETFRQQAAAPVERQPAYAQQQQYAPQPQYAPQYQQQPQASSPVVVNFVTQPAQQQQQPIYIQQQAPQQQQPIVVNQAPPVVYNHYPPPPVYGPYRYYYRGY
ncbi:hypothetical protein Terro_0071 [Terriglobus roseus DSM 18391]|uniref:Uncharacterized protein n=1 Tax=Terriglobus roseus (strain DSM 18391 / NRRL B-41598 / KBS 63) TaxID=926566 RepID=I3ZB04_TERRK|nr:hypothetical protein Terro_0071 [Terriglobus roseus DSM 18391]